MMKGVRPGWCFVLLVSCDQTFGLQSFSHLDAPAPDASPDRGCSDGTREGFPDFGSFRSIAGCAGAWRIEGLSPDPPVMCHRAAGNDGAQALGTNCTATDLCEAGWHVCRSRLEVIARLPVADRTCNGLDAAPNMLFVTAQSGPGGGTCGVGTNDVFGCGTMGPLADASCAPLDRSSDNQCFAIHPVGGWTCLDAGSEVTTIYKTDPAIGGGVMCCRDEIQL